MSLKNFHAAGALALICTFALVISIGSLRAAPVSSVNSGYQGYMQPAVPVAIPSASPTSAAVPLKGFVPAGIYMPAAFTGTTLTFTACDTVGGTYVAVKSTTSGTALSYTVAQGTYVALDPKDFQGINFLKIISGSTEAGLRTLKLALKGL